MFTTQADVKVKDFPDFVETLIEQFKSEEFRAGFIKLNKEKRVGNFCLSVWKLPIRLSKSVNKNKNNSNIFNHNY